MTADVARSAGYQDRQGKTSNEFIKMATKINAVKSRSRSPAMIATRPGRVAAMRAATHEGAASVGVESAAIFNVITQPHQG